MIFGVFGSGKKEKTMTKKTFLIAGLLLISFVCFAQNNWIIQDSGTKHDVICVHFNDSNIGWIAGGGTPATILNTPFCPARSSAALSAGRLAGRSEPSSAG